MTEPIYVPLHEEPPKEYDTRIRIDISEFKNFKITYETFAGGGWFVNQRATHSPPQYLSRLIEALVEELNKYEDDDHIKYSLTRWHRLDEKKQPPKQEGEEPLPTFKDVIGIFNPPDKEK